MKKVFISIISMLLPMLAMGQTLLYENDFTGITEFTGWSQFDDSQTDGKVEVDPDGVAITVGIQTGQLWQPQIMVVPDGSFNLKEDGNYKVIVTAKFPTDGTLQINMGTWSANDEAQFPIIANGNFQVVECDFEDWSIDAEGAHLLFQPGDFKGTTILKKIEIREGSLSYDKWTVAGDEKLFGANWDFTTNKLGTYDGENFILTKKNLMLSKGIYEFKVFNSISPEESYPSSYASLVIDEDAIYTVKFNFNANTKELSSTATKVGELIYNYITKGKIAEVKQIPTNLSGDIVIPPIVTHEGEEYTVTKIGDNAFQNCSRLTSVTIPNSVTSIGSYAFSGCI